MHNSANLSPAPAPLVQRLGEELPIFCERCGYSLQGLPQVRCDHCSLLQFHCPECGHHQPINTLRPAAQRILGRLRAVGLALLILIKLNFFGWTLLGWFWAGYFNSYDYYYWNERGMDGEVIAAFVLWGALWGLIARMLLLRWRHGGAVGIAVGSLLFGVILLGVLYGRSSQWRDLLPLSVCVQLAAMAALAVAFATMISWPLWVLMVHTLLPRRAGVALLDWQRSLSTASPPASSASGLGRD